MSHQSLPFLGEIEDSVKKSHKPGKKNYKKYRHTRKISLIKKFI
jgi:hypothetical protein